MYKKGERVTLVNVPKRYDYLKGKVGTFMYYHKDTDGLCEIRIDGDSAPTIVNESQLNQLDNCK